MVVDKEAGFTSHDVVARCRKQLGLRRVGHAGTLDPTATGVLLVGLGRVTRLLRFLTALPKSYSAEVVLGVATSTLDAAGEVVGTWDMAGVGADAVRAAAAALVGPIAQVPPMVSAVRVGGRRLHELARAGVEVERAPRPVVVHAFEVAPGDEAGVWRVHVECSSGTYVRVLAADLGAALGGGAHLRRLRRLRVGSFGVDDARPVGEVGPPDVLAPAEVLRDYPRVVVGEDVARAVGHGAVLDRDALGVAGDGPWAVVGVSGALLAVYESRHDRQAKPAVVMSG
ncbi:MAG: tRNA pseudouridine(55) synthase TruB [Acidimicrobiales bacterium]